MDYVMAFDVGTSTLKAILVNREGRVRKSSKKSYGVRFPKPGWVEMDPADWWRAVACASREIMLGCDVPPEDVKGVVFCCQAINVIPLGEDGAILRAGISWMDSRAEEEAQEVMDLMGGPEVCLSVVGTLFSGMDMIPKVRWLQKHEPRVFEKMRCPLDCNSYLIHCATGEVAIDLASASFWGYDRESGKMVDEMILAAGLDPARFPRVVKGFDAVGPLTPHAAEEMGLTTSTLVFGGTCDMQGTSIGSGMASDGDAHMYLGTSGWAAVCDRRVQTLSNGGGVIMSADPGLQLWVYSTETCCATFDWAVNTLFSAEKESPLIPNIYSFIDLMVQDIAPGCDGLIFNPWLSGERSPVPDVFVRGGFLNLDLTHNKYHMVRAVMEAVAYNLCWCYDSLEQDLGRRHPSVRILGGGTNSAVWMQMFADIFGRDIEVVQDSQIAGAIGAAFLAAVGLGIYHSFDEAKDWAKVSAVYRPNPLNRQVYAEGYARFRDSYAALKATYQNWNGGKTLINA